MTKNGQPEVLADLRERRPLSRRRAELYDKLDRTVPGWGDLVRKPEFARWATFVDSESGTCMLDRIQQLLDDPVYAAEDLTLILRRFARWSTARAIRKPSGFRRLFQSVDPLPPPRLPVLSGKYELIQVLGRGGNGEVYLVWSTETEKFYALKTIRSELARIPEVRQSFRNEALGWISMGEHPNIAKAYFFEEIGPHLYVTMAFVEGDDDGTGPSLADKLVASPIPMEKLIVWFCQIADGLDHAYRSGIRAHRDIKPGNILISRDGVAQVSDFGLAVTVETLIAAGAHTGAVGTPLYMSPEQFVNPTKCNQRSDIYSLGVSLYQAVSGGNLPFLPKFSPKTPADMARFFAEVRVHHEKVKPKSLYSPLWPIIAKCLSKSPSDRFSDIDAFRAKLASIGMQERISVPGRAKETTDFWALRDQGITFMRLSRYQEAIKAFDAFLAVMPDSSARFNRAVCLENLGRFEEALLAYQPYTDDIDGLVNSSNCLRKLGRKEEAFAYARRAVELKEDDVQCWIAMGNGAFSLDNWHEAMKAYTTAHRLDPSDPTPAYNFGLAALRAGLPADAKKAFMGFMDSSMPDDNRRAYVEKKLREFDRLCLESCNEWNKEA